MVAPYQRAHIIEIIFSETSTLLGQWLQVGFKSTPLALQVGTLTTRPPYLYAVYSSILFESRITYLFTIIWWYPMVKYGSKYKGFSAI